MSIGPHPLDCQASFAVEIGTDEACFDALRESWSELERACASHSLFMSWQWQRLWWTHYQAGRQLRILIARDGERLLGVLPMYLQVSRLGPLRLRRLRTLGAGGDTAPDDLDALLHPDCADRVASEFARQLLAPRAEWDAVTCPDLDPGAPFTRALIAAAEQAPRVLLRRNSRSIVCGPLPGKWDDYVHDLGAHRRKSLRRKLRKFESDGGAVVWHQGAQEVDEAFDRLAHLHRMRWAGRTAEHAFSSEEYLAFHRALMHVLDDAGALRLLELRMQGQAIAMRYGYRWGDTFYDLQSGFDPAFADYSPGELCISHCIERAIAEGCAAFDMLRGDYEHKRAFFKTERTSIELRAYRGLLLGLAVRAKSKLVAWRDAFGKLAASSRKSAPS